MTAKLNLSLRQGASYRRRLRWADKKGRAIDLTGASALAQLRDIGSKELLIELSQVNGGLTIVPAQGRIDIHVTAAQTAALAFSRAVWDLRITLANGDVIYLVDGFVTLDRSVTV